MAQLVRVASVSDLPPGTCLEATAHGQVVALFNVDNQFYALDGVCPHAGGPLGRGQLEGNVITCPWHGWQFDVTSGQHCLTSNIQHTTIPVTIEGDDVYVELP